MKRNLLNILAIASVLTTIGFLLDDDVVEISTTMRFVEYLFMLTVFFIITSGFYFGIKALKKRLQIIK